MRSFAKIDHIIWVDVDLIDIENLDRRRHFLPMMLRRDYVNYGLEGLFVHDTMSGGYLVEQFGELVCTGAATTLYHCLCHIDEEGLHLEVDLFLVGSLVGREPTMVLLQFPEFFE